MKIISDKISIAELAAMAKNIHGNLVKAMVDIEKGIMCVDGDLHADLMDYLIEKENSEPKNLWGINLYPDETGDNFIEFDSMMNLKPSLGNMTRGVDSKELRDKITQIISKLVRVR